MICTRLRYLGVLESQLEHANEDKIKIDSIHFGGWYMSGDKWTRLLQSTPAACVGICQQLVLWIFPGIGGRF
jgi:hypothetical protein